MVNRSDLARADHGFFLKPKLQLIVGNRRKNFMELNAGATPLLAANIRLDDSLTARDNNELRLHNINSIDGSLRGISRTNY